MNKVVMYSTRSCPWCIRARSLLASRGILFHDIQVDGDLARRHEMIKKAGRHTVPQIWVGETHVGGCEELYALERAGKLDELLNEGDGGDE